MILHAYSLINTLTQSEDDNPSFSPKSLTHKKGHSHVRKNWRSGISYEGLVIREKGQLSVPPTTAGATSLPFSHCPFHSFPISPFFFCPSRPVPHFFHVQPVIAGWHLSFTRVAMGLFSVFSDVFPFKKHIFFKTQSCIFCGGGPILKEVKIMAKLATGNWNLFGGRKKKEERMFGNWRQSSTYAVVGYF